MRTTVLEGFSEYTDVFGAPRPALLIPSPKWLSASTSPWMHWSGSQDMWLDFGSATL